MRFNHDISTRLSRSIRKKCISASRFATYAMSLLPSLVRFSYFHRPPPRRNTLLYSHGTSRCTHRKLVAKRTSRSGFREVAEVIEVETMTPGEGQVLIAVQYAGINGGCETFRYVDTLYIHHICISREGIYGCALDPCHFLQGAR